MASWGTDPDQIKNDFLVYQDATPYNDADNDKPNFINFINLDPSIDLYQCPYFPSLHISRIYGIYGLYEIGKIHKNESSESLVLIQVQ